MSYQDLYENVRKWAIDRNFHTDATSTAQACKLWEEYGELMTAFNKQRRDAIRDELGDMIVVSIVINVIHEFQDPEAFCYPTDFTQDWEFSDDPTEALLSIPEVIIAENYAGMNYDFNYLIEAYTHVAKVLGFTLEECLSTAYEKIKDRKGKMIAGKYVKESDLAKMAV